MALTELLPKVTLVAFTLTGTRNELSSFRRHLFLNGIKKKKTAHHKMLLKQFCSN